MPIVVGGVKGGFGLIPSVAGNLLESLEQPRWRVKAPIEHCRRGFRRRHDSKPHQDIVRSLSASSFDYPELPGSYSTLTQDAKTRTCGRWRGPAQISMGAAESGAQLDQLSI
jgi:hypothetical protein